MATALPHFLMGLPICVALSTEDFILTTSPYCACTAFNSCHDTSTWCVTPGDIVLLCTQSHSRRMPEAKMSKVISTSIDDLRGIAAGFLFGQLLLVTVGKSSVCECRGGGCAAGYLSLHLFPLYCHCGCGRMQFWIFEPSQKTLLSVSCN